MSTESSEGTAQLTHNGVVDVSNLPATRVVDYADEAGGRVHLERKGGRTFLVAE